MVPRNGAKTGTRNQPFRTLRSEKRRKKYLEIRLRIPAEPLIMRVLMSWYYTTKPAGNVNGVEAWAHLRENFWTPASNSSENTWSQVSGRVDSVTRVETHWQSNDQNHKSHSEGLQALGDGVVIRIHNCQDTHDQCCRANDLWEGNTQYEPVRKIPSLEKI